LAISGEFVGSAGGDITSGNLLGYFPVTKPFAKAELELIYNLGPVVTPWASFWFATFPIPPAVHPPVLGLVFVQALINDWNCNILMRLCGDHYFDLLTKASLFHRSIEINSVHRPPTGAQRQSVAVSIRDYSNCFVFL
jgi:hypothetical protein